MLEAFLNCLKIQELRQKLFCTLLILFVARIGAILPLPGIDPSGLHLFFASQAGKSGGSLLSLYDMFTGGALLKGAIFGLGVMPYISASIIFQLLTPVVPFLARLQMEGESGRKALTQYTRYATLVVCLIQGFLLTVALAQNPNSLMPGYDIRLFGPIVVIPHSLFCTLGTIFLTTGTMVLMWLGERITQCGIGNGVSLLIAVGILADLPQAVIQAIDLFSSPIGSGGFQLGAPQAFLMLSLLVLVVAAVVAVTQAIRKIPVQYVKRVVGAKIYGGQSSYLPLKINYSGVMPIIFASALLVFPQQIFTYLGAVTGYRFLQDVAFFLMPGGTTYYCLYSLLVFVFSYFWVSIMFKPMQIAEDLKNAGGYIPGIKPGDNTAKFLDFVMTRLTFAGAIFLLIIALFPSFLNTAYHIPYNIALFFGGTGTLISVGVVLDTMRQVESYLLQNHCNGFLQKGRLASKMEMQLHPAPLGSDGLSSSMLFLSLVLGLLFAGGIASWLVMVLAI